MRSKVISDLNDKRIVDICNRIFYYRKPENISADTYIRWIFIDQRQALFAGNKNFAEIYFIQIDIFSTGNYENLAKVIKNTLKEKRYLIYEQKDLVEELGDGSLLYHKVLRFKYTKYTYE